MKLYHITKVENVESIEKNGLVPKDGKVFLFDRVSTPYCEGLYRFDKWSTNMRDIEVEQIIAKTQLLIKGSYALFEVDVDGLKLEDDNCLESISKYEKYYEGTIEPSRIKYVGEFKIKPFWDYELLDYKYEVPAGCKVIRLKNNVANYGFMIAR